MHALQRADKLLGIVACLLLQPLRLVRLWPRTLEPSGRVLLIKFWGIGSLQLLTPAVRSARARHPDAELVLLTLAGNRDFALGLGVFDRVLCADVSSSSWCVVFARIVRLVLCLRSERFDVVYDFEFFTRFSALVALLTGARESHGFAASSVWRGGFHTHALPFNRYWHVARNFRALAGGEDGFGVGAADLDPPRFAAADTRFVAGLLERAGLAPGAPYAVLNPNAGALSLERRWPRSMFAELARRLARREDLAVVLIGSRAERRYNELVVELAGSNQPGGRAPINLAGELSPAQLAALLAGAAVCVSNDSGPMHLAAALGTATVGLFGPETPMMYAPIGLRTRALYRPPACSPCINVHDNKFASCIHGFPQCLVHITTDEVFDATTALAGGGELQAFELTPLAAPARAAKVQG
jgi:ADP-heptose:LPS heptosyltransferase